MTRALRILAIITAVLCFPLLACAATLQAKVVEVSSGNTLVVSNINRPVRIRLKAVVPPEAGQPFCDTAREHLKALVLDKAVTVEYTQLADGYLEAKVFLNGVDVGSQMLRDGVAWYDHTSDYQLTESDRDLYARCEQAARNDRRGLWQDLSPLAPWEFHRIQLAKLESINSSPSLRRSPTRRSVAKESLSNDDLLGAMMGSSSNSVSGQPVFTPIASNGSPDRWTRFDSEEEHFSILIPTNAVQANYLGPDPDGKTASFHYLAAVSPTTFHLLMSGKGPGANELDSAFTDHVIHGFVDGMNRALKNAGVTSLVTAKALRDLKVNGFTGKQYS